MTLIKDTSLANVIANKEIIMMAKEYSAKGLIWPLFSTALFFLVFVGAMTLLFNWLEKSSAISGKGDVHMALLEVTGISKNFGSTHVLQNISLNLEKAKHWPSSALPAPANNVAALPELFGNAGYRCDPCGRQNPVGCR